MGSGFLQASVMFTGEAPGRMEDRTGTGFQGQAGRKFDRMLEYLGLPREAVWLNNAVRCRPVEMNRNRAPHRDEIAACRPWLLRDVANVSPRVIVPLGRVAYQALTGRLDFSQVRGSIVEMTERTVAFPMFHPAYLIYRPASVKTVCRDLLQLGQLLDSWQIPRATGNGSWCESENWREQSLEIRTEPERVARGMVDKPKPGL